MSVRSIRIHDDDLVRDTGFVYICSGYLVENGKVLLVHHNVFNKWVPPGGHIEPNETFAQTAAREVKEETGLNVEVISAQPTIDPNDADAVASPVPFYVDVEHGFKPRPALVQFFWVRRADESIGRGLVPEAAEVYDVGWFDADALKDLPTFEQVRTLATYALTHHPDVKHNK